MAFALTVYTDHVLDLLCLLGDQMILPDLDHLRCLKLFSDMLNLDILLLKFR
jgi:hypothetical protein